MLVWSGQTLSLIFLFFLFSTFEPLTSCVRVWSPEGHPWLENVFTLFQPPASFCEIKFMRKASWSTCHTSLSFSVSRINTVCVFRSRSYVERRFLFLKGQEVKTGASAAARACTICACPVTLSSSSNIQTSVPFKLAGHGPVTYFPDNMLCNIKDEVVCHQLANLYRHTRAQTAQLGRNRGETGQKTLITPASERERCEQECRRWCEKTRKCQRWRADGPKKQNVKSISTVRADSVYAHCQHSQYLATALDFPLPLAILQPLNIIQHTNGTMHPYKTPKPAWAVIPCANSAITGTGRTLALFNEHNRYPGNVVWPCIGPYSWRGHILGALTGWFSGYMSHGVEVIGCE